MSQVIFNSRIDLVNVGATPSSTGYTVAYDVDGILKQKDEFGVITPISSSQNLEQTLQRGNYSGTYSIQMGTGSSIYSINGLGRISLDHEGNAGKVLISASGSSDTGYAMISNTSTLLSATSSGRSTSISVQSFTMSIISGSPTYSTFIEQTIGEKISIGHIDSTIGTGGRISVIETGKTYDGVGSQNKAYVHINANNASTKSGVQNSVIIGGTGLYASHSNMVVLGNTVSVNNAYTLPSTDGQSNQILATDGNGAASWRTLSISSPTLRNVLAAGNDSMTYSVIIGSGSSVILGTSSKIVSEINGNYIQLDGQGTNSGIILSSSTGASTLNINNTDASINTGTFSVYATSGKITTTNLQGLIYTSDYSATFTDESLVTKRFVESNSGSYQTHNVVYVDPAKGLDSTGQPNRPNRPYATISAAMIGLTSSTFTAVSRGLVYLRKGLYTDVARLHNYVDYYCEPDVVFTENGFKDFSAVDSNVYGYASFIGTNSSLVPLTSGYASNIRFEFDIVDNSASFGRFYGAGSNISVYGKKIVTKSSSGWGIKIESSANAKIMLYDGIVGANEVISIEDSSSGTIEINSGYITSKGDIGSSLSLPAIAVKIGKLVTSSIRISSQISDQTSVAIPNSAAVLIYSGTAYITGGISGGKNIAVWSGYHAGSSSYLSIDCDISSDREAIWIDASDMKIRNSAISTSGNGNTQVSIYVGGSGKLMINNSTIYNSRVDSSLINIGSAQSMMSLSDTIGYSEGEYGFFATHSLSITYSIGFHDVRSNKDNGDMIEDDFDPSGFFYDPNVWILNF